MTRARTRSWVRWIGWWTGVTLLVATCAAVLRGASPAAGLVVDDVRADADWILSAQFSDGAIANYVDKVAVWPYLSHFAAVGLVRATEVTGDARYLNAAWRWLSWYQSKQDASGFVTDYVVKDGVLTSTGDMDSTDAYAGMFLVAAREAYRVSGDEAAVRGLRTGIVQAVRAIEATQQPDGLTWAKPAWKVKYLMDQAEAFAGLVAAADLARPLNDATLSQVATSDAIRMRLGIDALWNSTTNTYDWAVHENGVHIANDNSILYPDWLQQAWAVAFGLVDEPRATDLLTRFNSAQPNWAQPTATAMFSGGMETVGYWPQAAFAFAEVGSLVAPLAVSTIRGAGITANRAWPYTTATAGQLIYSEAYTSPMSLLRRLVSITPFTAPTLTVPSASTPPAPRVVASPTIVPTTIPPTSTSTSTSTVRTTTTTSTTVPPVAADATVGGVDLNLRAGPGGVSADLAGTPVPPVAVGSPPTTAPG